ncbi:MAG TPA: FHA domain-containing protein [Candidatus Eremiobacteraeota bacterium]|nr:MAG: ABC transporter ATP-binding/permease protein [bacterium ADurb.Bin363]HPZ07153.1 FHA domain-containing protein [Candidatus Eremiobacteraeota bacterium]
MFPVLSYVKPTGEYVTLPLESNEIRFGRNTGNNIILDFDREASGNHARIICQSNRYFVEDLKSTNGTYINNNRINEITELKQNDKILIGKVEFLFTMPSYAPSSTPGTIPHQSFSHAYLHTAPLSVRQSPLDYHSMKNRQTVGRDPKSDISLNHPQVSFKHAEIQQSGSGYIITDSGSTNGTYLNNQRIKGSVPLKINDVVQIGPFKLMFDGNRLAQVCEHGNIRVDIAGLSVIRTKKKILNDIYLSIKPQDFVAIVGTSGAGKSTLLKSLCGAAFAEEGIVKVNGVDFYDNFESFRSILGYVPQDDIIHKELSVEKALKYAGELRLPSDTTSEETEKIITDTLLKLEMKDHIHKAVRSLSGGQRKRVSIGVEMLTNPSLFYLDEPTSGLDPATERNLMQLLRDRAKMDGKTVLCVTHVTKNVDLCDKIIVMGTGGFLTFYGTPREGLKFFGVTDFTDIYDNIKTADLARKWSEKFYSSEYFIKHIDKPLSEVGLSLSTPSSSGGVKQGVGPGKNTSSPFRQFFTLLKRYWDIKTRDPGYLIFTAVTPALVCFLLGLTFKGDVLKLTEKGENFGDATQLVFLLCCIALWFGSSNPSLEIISELPIYLRERMINLRLFPYVMSKVLVLGFMGIVQSILMTLVLLLFFKDMPRELSKLVIFTSGVFLVFLTSICLGLFVSAFANKSENASSVLPIVLVAQVILSGSIVPLGKMNLLPQMITFVMPSRWGFTFIGEALRIDELLNRALDKYEPIYGDFKMSFGSTLIPPGNDITYAMWVLIILSVVFLILCCLALWEKESRRVDFI